MEILLALLGSGSAGGAVTIGGAANARLRQTLKSPLAAAAVNFVVGFCTLALLLGLGVFQTDGLEKLALVPRWAYMGGFLGAIFVTLNTLTISKLGLTTTTLAIVLSQMVISLVIDHLGWFGVIQQPISFPRMAGISLLLAAVILIQLDKPRPSQQVFDPNKHR